MWGLGCMDQGDVPAAAAAEAAAAAAVGLGFRVQE